MKGLMGPAGAGGTLFTIGDSTHRLRSNQRKTTAKGAAPTSRCSYSKFESRSFLQQALSKLLLSAEHGTEHCRTHRHEVPATHQGRENIQIASGAEAIRKELREGEGAPVRLAGKETVRILGKGVGRQRRGGVKLGGVGGQGWRV